MRFSNAPPKHHDTLLIALTGAVPLQFNAASQIRGCFVWSANGFLGANRGILHHFNTLAAPVQSDSRGCPTHDGSSAAALALSKRARFKWTPQRTPAKHSSMLP